MSETGTKVENQDGDRVDESRTDSEPKEKETKSVSFNRDVHVKRFGELGFCDVRSLCHRVGYWQKVRREGVFDLIILLAVVIYLM